MNQVRVDFKKLILFLIVATLAAAVLGIINGSSKITLSELWLADNQPIVLLRLFRVLLASVAGCGLAVSGISLQAILRNPLAEPYLLGTSSGAGLGAVATLLLGISPLYMPITAFIGAIASVVTVYALARQGNKIPEQSLILSGVIVSIALSALIVFLITIPGKEAMHGITWWLWGSMQVYDFKLLFIVAGLVLFGVVTIYLFSQDLNAISIGEEEALHLGIDVEKVKKVLIIITSLITASIVCICGIIGFVGLLIPHLMRLVVGPNHKRLIPATCLAAMVFMVSCDTLSRVIFPPIEVPIGVITAFLGAPAFIIIFKKMMRP